MLPPRDLAITRYIPNMLAPISMCCWKMLHNSVSEYLLPGLAVRKAWLVVVRSTENGPSGEDRQRARSSSLFDGLIKAFDQLARSNPLFRCAILNKQRKTE